jgi:AAA domain
MEISTLLNLLAPYEPKEHRQGYISFFCPGCQSGQRQSSTRQAYLYANGLAARCSNTQKCGWQASCDRLLGIRIESADYFTKDIISPLDHPYWSIFLKERRISEATIQKYQLCVFTDRDKAPAPYLYERLCFPIYTFSGQFAGYTGRSKSSEDRRYQHFFIMDSNEFIGYGVNHYQGGGELVLTEGTMDVLAAAEKGRTALGCLTSSWSKERLQAISGWKPFALILGMDQDEAGMKGNQEALRYFGQYEPQLPINVLVHDYKDISEAWMAEKPMSLISAPNWLKDKHLINDEQDWLEYFPKNVAILQKAMDISLEAARSLQNRFLDSQRMNHTTHLIKGATMTAQALMNSGKVDQAAEIFQTLSFPTTIQPIAGDSLLNQIKEYQQKGDMGYQHDFIKSIDKAFNGFKGLCLLGGAPGVGKTILASQLAAGLLQQNPSFFCLFLSLELSVLEIGVNLAHMATQFSYDLVDIMQRIRFIESLDSLNTVNSVVSLLQQIENETGKKGFVVLDRIQLLGASDGSDLFRDEQRYDWVTDLRNKIYPMPVIGISELTKVHWGSGWLGMESFKGSGRGGHAADQALIITPLTDSQLSANITFSGLSIQAQPNFIHSNRELTDSEQQNVAQIREILKTNRKDYQVIHVPKARNGYRTQISVTNFYGERHYREGFR